MIGFLKTFFGIDVFGMAFDGDSYISDGQKQDIIVHRKRHGAVKSFDVGKSNSEHFFLLGSIFKGDADESHYNVDILTIKNLSNIKSILKKYNGKNMGIEFLVSDIKYGDNREIGKWFYNMKWIYEMCKKYNFQFILSSGANKYCELVSLKVFNILLKKSDIENKKYWNDLNVWLETKKRGGTLYDTN